MGYSQSELNNPYRADFVFAVTQGAVNMTMMDYLGRLPYPEVTCVWVMSTGSDPQPEQIDFKTLLERAKNSNPFNVPDGRIRTKNTDLINLVGARFLGGFQAQLGLPPGLDDKTNIVTLGIDTTSVTFNMMCKTFTVVQYTPGGQYNPGSWMKAEQGSGTPWIFTSKISLDLLKFGGDRSTLPAAVQDPIKSLNINPDSFSIQQLLLKLDEATLDSVPTITGVKSSVSSVHLVAGVFSGAYCATMKANNQPVLAHALTAPADPASLALTSSSSTPVPLAGRRRSTPATLIRCAIWRRSTMTSCRPPIRPSLGTGSKTRNNGMERSQ